MNENKESENSKINDESILSYDDKEQQTLFRIFGMEMTAPKGLKNPRIIYISFIIVNFIALLVIRNLISR